MYEKSGQTLSKHRALRADDTEYVCYGCIHRHSRNNGRGRFRRKLRRNLKDLFDSSGCNWWNNASAFMGIQFKNAQGVTTDRIIMTAVEGQEKFLRQPFPRATTRKLYLHVLKQKLRLRGIRLK